MILGIMQPYFFPYLGYFDLINYSDNWVVFDEVDYIRHGWINRNRILHPSNGWQYFIAPVMKNSTHGSIGQVLTVPGDQWKRKITSQLQHYKKYARFYEETFTLVEKCLASESEKISDLNVHILKCICEHLDIKFNPQYQSVMKLSLGPIEGPGDWALQISKRLGAHEYVNPAGGKSLFDPLAFRQAGIALTIRQVPTMTYDCRKCNFEPDLSIIDALMWNSPDQIRSWLEDQREGVRN